MTFHDHFSTVSAGYAKYRPHYPAALFDWLATTVEARELAWDCATGNGQAAEGLAERFTRVVATDASADQLRHADAASQHRVPTGGRRGQRPVHAQRRPGDLRAGDPLAAARRLLRGSAASAPPGSVIAVWGYHIPMVREDVVDTAIRHFHDVVVGPYWPPERRLVLDRFATIEFPFDQLAAPDFEMRCAWTLDDFAHYLGTQSATNRYPERPRRRPGARTGGQSRGKLGWPRPGSRRVFPGLLRAGRT